MADKKEAQEPELEEEDSWEDEEDEVYLLTDETGTERSFSLIAIVEVDEAEFALLIPEEASEDDETPLEVLILAYSESDEGEVSLTAIEDDDLFARVQLAANEALDELFGDDR